MTRRPLSLHSWAQAAGGIPKSILPFKCRRITSAKTMAETASEPSACARSKRSAARRPSLGWSARNQSNTWGSTVITRRLSGYRIDCSLGVILHVEVLVIESRGHDVAEYPHPTLVPSPYRSLFWPNGHESGDGALVPSNDDLFSGLADLPHELKTVGLELPCRHSSSTWPRSHISPIRFQNTNHKM